MKRTKSFSLEEDIIQTIIDYKNKYKLSSDSAALERIILEYRNGYCTNMEEIIKYLKANKPENEIVVEEDDPLTNVFNEAYNDMPD